MYLFCQLPSRKGLNRSCLSLSAQRGAQQEAACNKHVGGDNSGRLQRSPVNFLFVTLIICHVDCSECLLCPFTSLSFLAVAIITHQTHASQADMGT